MEDFGRIDIEKFIPYSRDLIEVLKNKKDANNSMQCLEWGRKLQSFCEAEFYEVQNLLEEYQKKIDACKQRIVEVKGEVAKDEDLGDLEHELEDGLQKQHSLAEELRIVNDQISDLEYQHASVENQKQTLIKCEKDVRKAQTKMSMEYSTYASITSIIPDMGDQTKISAQIVKKDKKRVEKFNFEATTPSFEICSNLWKMMDL